MRKGLIAILLILSALPAARASEASDSLARALATFWGSAFKTDDLTEQGRQEFLRGLGDVLSRDSIGRNAYMRGASMAFNVLDGFDRMVDLGLEADRDELIRAIMAYAGGKDVGFTPDAAGEYIDRRFRERSAQLYSPASQEAFIKEAAAAEGAVVTPSGLVFRVITEGEGPMPAEGVTVNVRYKGMLSDGTVFDETESPISLELGRVVPGMAEGIMMMKPGGRYDLVIPAALAYGERGAGGGTIPPGAALHFIVELID